MAESHAYPALTQELHYQASVAIARMAVDGCSSRDELLAAAVPLTEASTDSARRRAGPAIMTRLAFGRRRHVEPTGLHHLLAALSRRLPHGSTMPSAPPAPGRCHGRQVHRKRP